MSIFLETATAGDVRVITRSIFGEMDGASMVTGIEPGGAPSKNLLVFGQRQGQAWLAKFDGGSVASWQWFTNFQPKAAGLPNEATLLGAFLTSGGTYLLCGEKHAKPTDDFGGALIVTLDESGKTRSEAIYTSKWITGQRVITRVDACIRWKDGFALIGFIDEIIDGAKNEGPQFKTSYWILKIDDAGRVLIDLLIPEQIVTPSIKSVSATKDGGLLFAAINNTSTATQLVRVNQRAEVAATRVIHGQFQLVHEIDPTQGTEIYGRHEFGGDVIVQQLDEKLSGVFQLQGSEPAKFLPASVYRLSDGSFALFGQSVRASGNLTEGQIAYTNSKLSSFTVHAVSDIGQHDSGQVRAVARLSDQGPYVVAQPIFSEGGLFGGKARWLGIKVMDVTFDR